MSDNKTLPDASGGTSEKKHVGGELLIPVAGIIFTIYYFSTILDSPWTAQVSAFFIGSVLTLLVTIFLIKTFVEVRNGKVDLQLGPLIAPNAMIPKRVALLALTIGYIVVVEYAGFTITTFLFMALSMMLLTGARNKRFILSLSAVIAIGGWALFILAFNTRFPKGPFELLMEGLM
ncbi:MAG: tripartite tricarboxylate transporter TctB family protein [Rhodospirillales bacterium]|jgi:hypothetical protein|nr:tripartite tricarboxylate transporter TctB family protein [Rhodospirillales bacterium]